MPRWVAAAGDLLLGAACPGCGAAWWGVCPGCRAELAQRLPRWTRPDPCPAGFPPTVTSSTYDAVLRGLVNAHKEHQALGLTPVLGERLARCVDTLLVATPRAPGPVALVPVPSAARVVRERGLDATAAMARAAARRLRSRHRVRMVPALLQVPGVHDQSGLGARDRQANLAGGLRLRGRAPDIPVVLVDDLVTTGASLTEAARVLRGAGVRVLGAATVAATVRRGGAGVGEKTVRIPPSL